MRTARLILITIAIATVGACGGSPQSTKYTQTWTKSYSMTNCTDWNHVMDDHQQFVMAADFLLTLQRKDKADATIPADGVINNFAADIGTVCTGNTGFSPDQEMVGDVASLVYLQGNTYKP
jgi:hypothetical protein